VSEATVALPSIGGVPPTKPDGYTKKSKGLVSGSAGSQGPDGLRNSKGNPRNRHGEWALEERHGQSLATQNNKTSRGSKQKLKATSEEINKRKQTLAQKKQEPTRD
jgi:hypothetical protein